MKEKFDLVWEKVFSLLAQIGGTCHLENAGATGIWERNVPPFLPCLNLCVSERLLDIEQFLNKK